MVENIRMSNSIEFNSRDDKIIEGSTVVGLLALYLLTAFIFMLAVFAWSTDIIVRGAAFPFVHGAAAVLAYRMAVAPTIDQGSAAFEGSVERLAAGFALFAVCKHIALLIAGRMGEWLASIDRMLIWAVDSMFLNTSLLPDVAALGILATAIRLFEAIRRR